MQGQIQECQSTLANMAGIGLRTGDRVALTGALEADRPFWEQRVVAAGLQVCSVTKETAVLVA